MFAIMYVNNIIVKINKTNEHEFKDYYQVQTFQEAKNELIAYWDMIKNDAIRNIKEAKKLREN